MTYYDNHECEQCGRRNCDCQPRRETPACTDCWSNVCRHVDPKRWGLPALTPASEREQQ